MATNLPQRLLFLVICNITDRENVGSDDGLKSRDDLDLTSFVEQSRKVGEKRSIRGPSSGSYLFEYVSATNLVGGGWNSVRANQRE